MMKEIELIKELEHLMKKSHENCMMAIIQRNDLLDALEEYMRANKALSSCGYDDVNKLRAAREDFFDAEKDAITAIEKAKGQ